MDRTPQTSEKSAQQAALGALNYVQTKVVPLSAEHLERQRIVALTKTQIWAGLLICCARRF